jgi:MFS family permease
MHTPHLPVPFSRFLREYMLLDVNPVIRFLILSDIVWRSGVGLLTPVFPIFIIERIVGGNELVAGVAATIGLVTKGIFQVPAAAIIDKIRGEKDDFWMMITFSFLTLLMPISYLFIRTPGQLYVVEFFSNLFLAFTFPSFMAIFTRHVDRQKEGTTWGLYFTLTDFAGAASAAVGGAIALTLGFDKLIIATVSISIMAVFLLIPIRSRMRRARKQV